MAKQINLDRTYMQVAYAIAELSQAKRKKVGAILVAAKGGIIAEGFNGTPAGFDNNCENIELRIDGNEFAEGEMWVEQCCTKQPDGTWLSPRHNIVREHLVTKPEVLHAESNAIMKVARSTNSSEGATLYTTLMPCLECAKLIIQAGIKRVVYSEIYPYVGFSGQQRPMGLKLLEEAKIPVDMCCLATQDSFSHERELEASEPITPEDSPFGGH